MPWQFRQQALIGPGRWHESPSPNPSPVMRTGPDPARRLQHGAEWRKGKARPDYFVRAGQEDPERVVGVYRSCLSPLGRQARVIGGGGPRPIRRRPVLNFNLKAAPVRVVGQPTIGVIIPGTPNISAIEATPKLGKNAGQTRLRCLDDHWHETLLRNRLSSQ